MENDLLERVNRLEARLMAIEEKYEKYYDKKIEMPEKEIEIRWNKRWEEEGFPTDDKDDKGRYLY